MKCLWCVENSKTYGSDKFVVGTNNFRLSTITNHEVSVKHKQVMPDVSLDVLHEKLNDVISSKSTKID